MRLLVQFPTLARPEKFLRVLDSYVSKISSWNQIFFNINCDVDDETMNDAYIRERIKYILNKRNFALRLSSVLQISVICWDNMLANKKNQIQKCLEFFLGWLKGLIRYENPDQNAQSPILQQFLFPQIEGNVLSYLLPTRDIFIKKTRVS